MFKHIEAESETSVAFTFEGRQVTADRGDSIASALLAAGEIVFRNTAISGVQRGPFCMMGVCFECLVEVDGAPGRQACMVPVREGMVVRKQAGAATVNLT